MKEITNNSYVENDLLTMGLGPRPFLTAVSRKLCMLPNAISKAVGLCQLEETGTTCMFRSQIQTVGVGSEAGSAGRDNFGP